MSTSVLERVLKALCLLSFGLILSLSLLRVVTGFVDESGKFCAGSLQESAQLGLVLCMALARAGCNHEEPRYFRRSATECELLCGWLVPVATEAVMARMTGEESRSLFPTKEAEIRSVASLKLSSTMSVKVTNHIVSPPCLFVFYNDISLSTCINNTIYRYYSHMSGESWVTME